MDVDWIELGPNEEDGYRIEIGLAVPWGLNPNLNTQNKNQPERVKRIRIERTPTNVIGVYIWTDMERIIHLTGHCVWLAGRELEERDFHAEE